MIGHLVQIPAFTGNEIPVKDSKTELLPEL
jgi:hypothetical protein